MSGHRLLVLLLVSAAATAVLVAVRAHGLHRLHRRLVPPPPSGARPAIGTDHLARALDAADLPLAPLAARRLWTGLLVAGGLVGLVSRGPVGGVLAAAVAAGAPAAALHASRHRRGRRIDRELPSVLDAVAAALRGGASLRGAVAAGGQVPGPAGESIAGLAAAAEAGAPLERAAARWCDTVGTDAARLVGAALGLAASSGATAPMAVDGVAATLRERAEVADEVRALGAQARLSAVVIVVAPLGFAAVAAAADPRTVGFLLGSPLGLACLAGGLVLDLVALVWMRRITAAVA